MGEDCFPVRRHLSVESGPEVFGLFPQLSSDREIGGEKVHSGKFAGHGFLVGAPVDDQDS